MAVIEISKQLLESLKHLAATEGVPVNQLAENFLVSQVKERELANEPNLELDELLASIEQNELEKAKGIEVSEEDIDSAVAELIANYPKKQKRNKV